MFHERFNPPIVIVPGLIVHTRTVQRFLSLIIIEPRTPPYTLVSENKAREKIGWMKNQNSCVRTVFAQGTDLFPLARVMQKTNMAYSVSGPLIARI